MNNSRPVSLWREGSLAACLYTAATLVMAYPLSTNPAGSVLPMASDTDLLLWLVAWDVHALVTDPLSIFDANIYYPFRYTLAYAENVIGSGLLAAPVLLLTGNMVLALNFVSLLSCVLCGLGTYLLIRRVGFGPAAATLGGLIFAFAPPRFFRLGQLHLTAVQWIPFALAFLHQYFDTGVRRKLWWACGFFALQAFTSGHGAVFAAVSIALLSAWRFALGEPLRPIQRIRDFGVPGFLFLGLAVLPLLPYRVAQREVGLRRTLGDAYAWAPNVATLLASPTHLHAWLLNRWFEWPVLSEAIAFLFPGYLALGFGLAGIWTLRSTGPRSAIPGTRTAWTRLAVVLEVLLALSLLVALAATLVGGFRWRFYGTVIFSARNVWRPWLLVGVLLAARLALMPRAPFSLLTRLGAVRARYLRWAPVRRRDAVAFYTLLTIVTFWLSLGPEYWLYWFVYDLPGFNFIRVPTRYTLPSLIGLSVLAAAGFEWAAARLRPSLRTAAAVVVGLLLLVEYAAMPLNAVPYRVEVPAIDRWLTSQPKPFVVAELPLDDEFNIGAWERRHSLFMLHSTVHWQKTVHGYSGIRPAFHSQLYSEMTRFPDEVSLLGLARAGVTYVVIHTDYYPPGEWAKVEARLPRYQEWLKLEKVEGAGRIYSLYRPSNDSLLRNRQAEFAEALAARDIDKLPTFYALDAILVRPGGQIATGRLNIADWILQHPEEAASVAFDTSRIDTYSGIVSGRFTQRATPGTRTGEYTIVWKLVDDRWMIASDLFSATDTRP